MVTALIKKVLAVFSLVMVLAACNTFEGLGRDIQKAGQHLEQAAEKQGTSD